MKENFFEENERNQEFEALVEYINQLPKATVKVLNYERFALMVNTAVSLQKLIGRIDKCDSIKIDIIKEFNMGAITIEAKEITVEDPAEFAAAVLGADNFEIYPLVNGHIRLDVTFYSILKSIA